MRRLLHLVGALPVVVAGFLASGSGVTTNSPWESSRVIVVLHTSQLQPSTDNNGVVTTVTEQKRLCSQLVDNIYFECEP
jgi:hypothetical protein